MTHLEKLPDVEKSIRQHLVRGSVELHAGNADSGLPKYGGVCPLFHGKHQHMAFIIFVLSAAKGKQGSMISMTIFGMYNSNVNVYILFIKD